MKTVITYGTFDVCHIGHVNMLKRAKSLGDRLIVGVSTDEFNTTKGKRALLDFQNRSSVVQAIRYVDLVIPETDWAQKESDINNYDVDIFVIGDDWAGEFDFLKSFCEVVYLPRTDGISSTAIRNKMAKNNCI